MLGTTSYSISYPILVGSSILELVSKESRSTLACLYRTSGRVYMLQFISVDSSHFTPLIIGKGHLLIESAQHSLLLNMIIHNNWG